jgi:hypothetical protein
MKPPPIVHLVPDCPKPLRTACGKFVKRVAIDPVYVTCQVCLQKWVGGIRWRSNWNYLGEAPERMPRS